MSDTSTSAGDKRRTKNNNLEFLIGWCVFPDPKDDTWDPLGHLSGSEHMIREFNERWEKDYVRKMVETLEAQTVRRKRAAEQNAQREEQTTVVTLLLGAKLVDMSTVRKF